MTKKDDKRYIVITKKRFMIVYEILYLVGLALVFISFILDYLFGNRILLLGIGIASILFFSATLLWAFDRKTIPYKNNSNKKI